MKKECPDHTAAHQPADGAVLISRCGCAIVSLTESGAAVYDMQLLIEHFHEHEGMGEHDEEGEERSTATEWIAYNVLRGLDYMSWEDNALMPVVMDEEYQVYPYEADEESVDE